MMGKEKGHEGLGKSVVNVAVSFSNITKITGPNVQDGCKRYTFVKWHTICFLSIPLGLVIHFLQHFSADLSYAYCCDHTRWISSPNIYIFGER